MMEIRYTHSPEDIKHYSTEELCREFLVESVFVLAAYICESCQPQMGYTVLTEGNAWNTIALSYL